MRQTSMAELPEINDKPVDSKGMSSKYFTLFCLCANLCLSVSIVLLNKILYTNIGFPNVTLTLLHFIMTSLGLVLCERSNIFEVKHIPILKIFPLALSFCGFVVLTNLSLGYNSVGTYQIIKTLTMPSIMFIQQVFYNRTFSLKIKLTLVPVTVGVILNSAYDVNFNVPGTAFACLGVVVTSVYQVWVGEKQRELQVNSMQLLYYQAPLSAVLLLIFLPAIEPPWVVGAVLDHRWTLSDMALILASGLNAFLINLSIYWIIGNTSAVTYNIVGQLKFCLTLLGGYVLFRELILPIQFLGILVTFSGVYLYAHVKLKEQERMTELPLLSK